MKMMMKMRVKRKNYKRDFDRDVRDAIDRLVDDFAYKLFAKWSVGTGGGPPVAITHVSDSKKVHEFIVAEIRDLAYEAAMLGREDATPSLVDTSYLPFVSYTETRTPIAPTESKPQPKSQLKSRSVKA